MRSSLSSFASELLRDSFPYLALIELSPLLYSAMNAAFFSFSEVVLVGTSCIGAAACSFLVAGLRRMTKETWLVLVLMGAAASVLTGAFLEGNGMKPGGSGIVFLLNSGESGLISMSASLGMGAESWADVLLEAFSWESSQA